MIAAPNIAIANPAKSSGRVGSRRMKRVPSATKIGEVLTSTTELAMLV